MTVYDRKHRLEEEDAMMKMNNMLNMNLKKPNPIWRWRMKQNLIWRMKCILEGQ